MKQVDIGGFVLAEVPKDSVAFEIYDKESLPLAIIVYRKDPQGLFEPGIPEPHWPLPPGKYQIVGLAKDLTPDQWCEIFGTEYDAHCFMKQNKLLHETTLIIKKMS